jgi:hypothetical protein
MPNNPLNTLAKDKRNLFNYPRYSRPVCRVEYEFYPSIDLLCSQSASVKLKPDADCQYQLYTFNS